MAALDRISALQRGFRIPDAAGVDGTTAIDAAFNQTLFGPRDITLWLRVPHTGPEQPPVLDDAPTAVGGLFVYLRQRTLGQGAMHVDVHGQAWDITTEVIPPRGEDPRAFSDRLRAGAVAAETAVRAAGAGGLPDLRMAAGVAIFDGANYLGGVTALSDGSLALHVPYAFNILTNAGPDGTELTTPTGDPQWLVNAANMAATAVANLSVH